ncbi:hypothetical protein MTQ13_03250 [Streptomyces sp. XM4011]|uniref:hypothetical protein n=1 Tax=Streptomyces sp. XM4011 TaxID=2929780 RepID=UPI001FFA8702|nr:hypothetical protein [Streptomyces sp. XM4011]MCK1813298.1 hypothetical protein [Streptomyces sp. XM4011]
MNTLPADLGATQAAAIRESAAELAAIPDITASSASREILLDLATALADLCEPVEVLVDEHLDGMEADAAHQAECVEAVAALTTAASGLMQAARNE